MKEAILIVVSDGFGGLGDFLFALKLIESLRHKYSEKGEEIPPIYLITQSSGQEIIEKLKADVAFDVEVLTPADLYARVRSQSDDQIVVRLVIEGPALSTYLIEEVDSALNRTNIPLPLITISEYGDRDDDTLNLNLRHRHHLSSLKWVKHIRSGFNVAKLEHGIVQVSKIVSRQDAILHLHDKIKSRLGISDDTFFNQNEISLQYSHDQIGIIIRNRVQDDPAQRFLALHREFYKKSDKNQFILMIGREHGYKLAALKSIQGLLINDGFEKIVFYNEEKDREIILYASGKPGKQYTVLYFPGLTYQAMINCIALSGPLMGVTGDQSLGEGLQYGKIPIYETVDHKIDFIADYEKRVYEISGKDPTVKQCLEILRPSAAPSGQRGENTYQDGGAYVHQHQTKLQESIQQLLQQSNLVDSIYHAEIEVIKQQLLQYIAEFIVIVGSDYAIQYYNQYRHKLSPENDSEIRDFSTLIERIGIINVLEYFYQNEDEEETSASVADCLIKLNMTHDAYQSVFVWLIDHQQQICLQAICSQASPPEVIRAFFDTVIKRDKNNALYFTHLSKLKKFEITPMYIKAMYVSADHLLHSMLPDAMPGQTIKNEFISLYQSFLLVNDKNGQMTAHDALIGLFLLEITKSNQPQSRGWLPSSNWLQWGQKHKNLTSISTYVLTGLGINDRQLSESQSHYYIQQYQKFIADITPMEPAFTQTVDDGAELFLNAKERAESARITP